MRKVSVFLVAIMLILPLISGCSQSQNSNKEKTKVVRTNDFDYKEGSTYAFRNVDRFYFLNLKFSKDKKKVNLYGWVYDDDGQVKSLKTERTLKLTKVYNGVNEYDFGKSNSVKKGDGPIIKVKCVADSGEVFFGDFSISTSETTKAYEQLVNGGGEKVFTKEIQSYEDMGASSYSDIGIKSVTAIDDADVSISGLTKKGYNTSNHKPIVSTVTASKTSRIREGAFKYGIENIDDESLETCWATTDKANNGVGTSFCLYPSASFNSIIITPGYYKHVKNGYKDGFRYTQNSRVTKMRIEIKKNYSENYYSTVLDISNESAKIAKNKNLNGIEILLDNYISAEYIRFTVLDVKPGTVWPQDLCISNLSLGENE